MKDVKSKLIKSLLTAWLVGLYAFVWYWTTQLWQIPINILVGLLALYPIYLLWSIE